MKTVFIIVLALLTAFLILSGVSDSDNSATSAQSQGAQMVSATSSIHVGDCFQVKPFQFAYTFQYIEIPEFNHAEIRVNGQTIYVDSITEAQAIKLAGPGIDRGTVCVTGDDERGWKGELQ